MPQYDCILRWANLAAARSDAAALANMLPDDQGVQQWMADHVVADMKVWRNSQDTTDSGGHIVHTFMSGYFALISMSRRVAALENNAGLQLIVDRDKMNARQSGFVLVSNVSAALLADIRFQPVLMGMDVPWGGLN